MDNKIYNFTDLNCWKEAHRLAILIYKATQSFPKDERFSLIDQIRRSAVSVTSNIAEGFGRNTAKDKSQFYAIARGSIYELESQLLIARDLGYLRVNDFDDFKAILTSTGKMLSGLIKSAPNH